MNDPVRSSAPDHASLPDRASLARIIFWLVLAVVLGALAVAVE
jgi:uncharacterized protein involved in exopolysaccharide biosynthesis